jgi:hypothetical protein
MDWRLERRVERGPQRLSGVDRSSRDCLARGLLADVQDTLQPDPMAIVYSGAIALARLTQRKPGGSGRRAVNRGTRHGRTCRGGASAEMEVAAVWCVHEVLLGLPVCSRA